MFLDEAIITVIGGKGGDGCVGWRREKYVPKGGPDGGNGGRGGNVIIRVNENTDTLSDYSSRKEFEAQEGHFGMGSNKAGKEGQDTILDVPPGTIVTELDPETREPIGIIADLREHGDQIIVVYGGKGGFGNAHFASSVRQRPDFAELGEPGEERLIKLELKLVADVGVIGFPSVGKSTLISVVSNARPKIAAYPFTTLVPNLGVVHVHDRSFVVCDVPGLIEGASEGKGLGDTFLKHIERTGILLHMLDISRALLEGNTVDVDQLETDYRAIRKELEAYSPALALKREVVVLNKSDLVESLDDVIAALKKKKIVVAATISAATKQGTDQLMEMLLPIVLEEREKRVMEYENQPTDLLPVLRPQEESNRMDMYKLTVKQDGTVTLRGKRLEQFTAMTNFESQGSLLRFRDVLQRVGVLTAIKKAAKDEDTPVYIGEIRIDSYL